MRSASAVSMGILWQGLPGSTIKSVCTPKVCSVDITCKVRTACRSACSTARIDGCIRTADHVNMCSTNARMDVTADACVAARRMHETPCISAASDASTCNQLGHIFIAHVHYALATPPLAYASANRTRPHPVASRTLCKSPQPQTHPRSKSSIEIATCSHGLSDKPAADPAGLSIQDRGILLAGTSRRLRSAA